MPQPFSACKDGKRIGDGAAGGRHPGLFHPARCSPRCRDDLNSDLRHFGHAHDSVDVEIRLLDLAVHDADLAIALPLLGLLAPIVRSRLNELAAVALQKGGKPASQFVVRYPRFHHGRSQMR